MNNTQQSNRPVVTQNTLNVNQSMGILLYDLNLQDVHSPNFGSHSLIAIDNLILIKKMTNKVLAFEMIKGLTEAQAQGVSLYDLEREDVCTSGFEKHILHAIDLLKSKGLASSNRDAFEMIKGLDSDQIMGICVFELTKEQVNTPKFGIHTLEAIKLLVLEKEAGNFKEAFEMVKELSTMQVIGIVNFKLKREQVMHPEFSLFLLNMLTIMQVSFPDTNLVFCYNEAIKIQRKIINNMSQNQPSQRKRLTAPLHSHLSERPSKIGRTSGVKVATSRGLVRLETTTNNESNTNQAGKLAPFYSKDKDVCVNLRAALTSELFKFNDLSSEAQKTEDDMLRALHASVNGEEQLPAEFIETSLSRLGSFSRGNSDASLDLQDRKPAAIEGNTPKNQLAGNEVIEQEHKNPSEQNEYNLGELDSQSLWQIGAQEASITVCSELMESFMGLERSPVARLPSNAARLGDASSNSTYSSKKGNKKFKKK